MNVNVLLALLSPSDTVIVTGVVPIVFDTGVSVAVRAAPVPPNVIAALVSSTVFDEDPLRVSDPNAVSASPTVKFTVNGVFMGVV